MTNSDDNDAVQAILWLLVVCVGIGTVTHYLNHQPEQKVVQVAKNNGITKEHFLFWTQDIVNAGQQQYRVATDKVKTQVTHDQRKLGQLKVITTSNRYLPFLKQQRIIKYVTH